MPAKPDLIWNAEDWEATFPADDSETLAEDLRFGGVMRVGRAVQIPDAWFARNLDGELREFPTEDEARAWGSVDPAAAQSST